MNYLNRPKWNFIALFTVVVLATIVVASGDWEGDRERSKFVIIALPFIIGIITLLLYGVSRLILKKYNWIITLLGILFLLNASLQFYLK